jgi:hypothetical protein
MTEKQLHCLTTDILCSHGAPADHLLYLLNNVAQRGSRLTRPFATGMFMMVEKARFDELGGFDERALFAEDYQFTRQIDRRRFRVVGGGIRSTNRRFQKMGHGRIVRMFLKTAWNGRSSEYYRNSLHRAYWEAR